MKAARRQGSVKKGLREAIGEATKVVIWAKWGATGEQGAAAGGVRVCQWALGNNQTKSRRST